MNPRSADSAVVYRVGPDRSRLDLALADLAGGFSSAEVWMLLAWQDVKQRYRRSVLGPFWLSINTGVLIGMLSFLYGTLFHLPQEIYTPFVGVGVVVWTFIASLLSDACTAFISVEAIVKQIRAPLTLHVCRMVWRNVLVFAHNALIVLLIYLIFGKGWHWDLLLVAPAVLAIAVNGVWAGIVLGVVCARYRDIPPIVANLVQVAFFVTPIMWMPELLEARGLAWAIELNLAHHFIEIVRAPILSAPVPAASWLVVAVVTAAGAVLSLGMLQRYRHRVAYWT